MRRPQTVWDVTNPLLKTALIAFLALKFAGVVTWSWWWVLSPLWMSVAPLVLLAGGLFTLWCLDHWPFTLVSRRVRYRVIAPESVRVAAGTEARGVGQACRPDKAGR